MTATLTAPANGAGAIVAPAGSVASLSWPDNLPLWGEIEAPLIVGTGDFGTGKTSFGLAICPGPRTLVYDNEGSSIPFRRQLGFDHVDMADELRKAHTEKFTAKDRYLWWRQHAIERGKTGKYRVLMVDPASELEDGLAEYIRTNVSLFGLTADQVTKSSGLFWGVMKAEWKKTLDLLRTYYETVYLTVHLRLKFIGNKPDPNGALEPKGKETLYELSSLFLWFEKNEKSACPTARVEKSRLSKYTVIDGELTPIAVLPPQLPRATPKAIRDYIATPPDYSKLKPAEKVREHVMTEDEKLRYNATIATANAEAATAEYNKLALMQQNAAAQAAKLNAAVPPPDRSAAHASDHAAKAAANVRPPISAHQIGQIIQLLTDIFGGPATQEANEWLAPRIAEFGIAKPTDMTDAQGDGLHSELLRLKSDRERVAVEARGKELMATSHVGSTAEPPFEPTHSEPVAVQAAPAVNRTPPAPAERPTPEQIAEAYRLVPLAFPDPSTRGAKLPGLCLKHGSPNPKELTRDQMAALLAEMQQLADTNAAPPALKVRPEMISKLRDLCEKVGWPREKQMAWLNERGLKLLSEASQDQIDGLIEQLSDVAASFDNRGSLPGN